MDDCDALIPEWLKMATGVVDSADLHLDVSRETLRLPTSPVWPPNGWHVLTDLYLDIPQWVPAGGRLRG